MSGHYIQMKRIGTLEDDKWIILIDGYETGDPLPSEQAAKTVKDWLTSGGISQLEQRL